MSQLHAHLLELIPGGAKKDLSAAQAKTLLATVRPRDIPGKAGLQDAALPRARRTCPTPRRATKTSTRSKFADRLYQLRNEGGRLNIYQCKLLPSVRQLESC